MEFTLSKVSSHITKRDFDVLIIGAGAAGLSAAVYAVRSGLSAIVLDKSVSGGLTAESPLVENYLGFRAIKGTELAVKFTEHALDYVKILENTEVLSIEMKGNVIVAKSPRGEFTGKSLIIASGTSHKHLGIPGESAYFGRGVSYCSTCDGYLFRNKKVTVIGGGNSGAIAALSMKEYAGKITIIEFMDRYMCEDAYARAIKKNQIEYLINSRVVEILGDGKKATSLKIMNRKTGNLNVIDTDAVFIYVGLSPQTEFLKGSGIDLDAHGYVVKDSKGRTNVEGIYAAGDVTTETEAQIAAAVGDGCRVAITLFGDLLRSGEL